MSDRVYRYQLTKSEYQKVYAENSQTRYELTEELGSFNNKMSKVALLLTTGDKCKNYTITFDEEDKKLFCNMSRRIYASLSAEDKPLAESCKIRDMTKTFYDVLIEQSIVCVVSCWDYYVSAIIEKIFNDKLLVKKLLNDMEIALIFFRKFRISDECDINQFLNNDSIENSQLGTYIINKRKINCQDLDNAKYILKLLFDYEIVQRSPQEWTSVTELFETRHSIIHRKDTSNIIEKYDREKIFYVANTISNIIHDIDKHLFHSIVLGEYYAPVGSI
jgi:hypothetical protein